MTEARRQKTKTLGYIDISAISGHEEWQGYSKATTHTDRGKTKEAVRKLIKDKLPDLDNDAVIDFIKYDDDRLQVSLILEPPKSKRRSTDLSSLFERSKKK
jgi:hypothetical protein